MQCVIVKEGVRCTNQDTDYGMTGVHLPIVKPEAIVFVCVACIDEMAYVAHLPERGMLDGLGARKTEEM
jgi:hypothetical protein